MWFNSILRMISDWVKWIVLKNNIILKWLNRLMIIRIKLS